MHRSRRGRNWRLLAPAVLLLMLGGCEVTELRIEIPGYGQGNIDGIWLWRFSADTATYERIAQIVLSSPQTGPNGESVSYFESCPSAGSGTSSAASLVRSTTDPDTVTMKLMYYSCDGTAGTYKASVYNGAGESDLSLATVTF